MIMATILMAGGIRRITTTVIITAPIEATDTGRIAEATGTGGRTNSNDREIFGHSKWIAIATAYRRPKDLHLCNFIQNELHECRSYTMNTDPIF